RAGALAEAGRGRLLQLPCRADQRSCPGRVPAPCHRPLAAHATASQSEGSDDVGADDATGGRVAPETKHPTSLAERSLCRHTPEVGAACGKVARAVLCGGRVMKHASLPLLRPRFADSIRASSRFGLHQKAGHMTASDPMLHAKL